MNYQAIYIYQFNLFHPPSCGSLETPKAFLLYQVQMGQHYSSQSRPDSVFDIHQVYIFELLEVVHHHCLQVPFGFFLSVLHYQYKFVSNSSLFSRPMKATISLLVLYEWCVVEVEGEETNFELTNSGSTSYRNRKIVVQMPL